MVFRVLDGSNDLIATGRFENEGKIVGNLALDAEQPFICYVPFEWTEVDYDIGYTVMLGDKSVFIPPNGRAAFTYGITGPFETRSTEAAGTKSPANQIGIATYACNPLGLSR